MAQYHVYIIHNAATHIFDEDYITELKKDLFKLMSTDAHKCLQLFSNTSLEKRDKMHSSLTIIYNYTSCMYCRGFLPGWIPNQFLHSGREKYYFRQLTMQFDIPSAEWGGIEGHEREIIVGVQSK